MIKAQLQQRPGKGWSQEYIAKQFTVTYPTRLYCIDKNRVTYASSLVLISCYWTSLECPVSEGGPNFQSF